MAFQSVSVEARNMDGTPAGAGNLRDLGQRLHGEAPSAYWDLDDLVLNTAQAHLAYRYKLRSGASQGSGADQVTAMATPWRIAHEYDAQQNDWVTTTSAVSLLYLVRNNAGDEVGVLRVFDS
ncbi:MAG: hypothetical protein AAF682_07480 [Planctomycetota bacterium]